MRKASKQDLQLSEAERRYAVCLGHGSRITTTFIVCGTCQKRCELKETLGWCESAISDKDARAYFVKKGWTIKPTRCPKHAKRRKHVSTRSR